MFAIFVPWSYLFILCDGHSGALAAEIVCNRLPEIFSKNLNIYGENVNSAISSSFIEMDEELKECKSEGTTCNLIYIFSFHFIFFI